ncbi:CPBP family intramembrane glutamic endopeptidase [Streptomyces sp. NPDC056835]|uniref:CPBP family intramembrane glutamic endopeptidase n=1 Tax=Streptomyces sp. NPDC056835 TaxID=3345956 RepID=UPI0036BADD26
MSNHHLTPAPAAVSLDAAPDAALDAASDAAPARTVKRPGWPEIAVAAVTYGVLVAVGIAVILSMPDEQAVARGIVSYAVSALAGLGAFGIAVIIRVRDLGAFGLRRVAGKWLLLGAGLGVGAFLLNVVVGIAYVYVSGDTSNPQGDYKAAAGGGALSFLLTILFGAIATPIGEELAFRGVLANALGRYGPWVGVIASSAIFALVHGVNIIMPIAFVVGATSALLLRKTGSVWPGVCVHAVNNGISVLLPALAALSTT